MVDQCYDVFAIKFDHGSEEVKRKSIEGYDTAPFTNWIVFTHDCMKNKNRYKRHRELRPEAVDTRNVRVRLCLAAYLKPQPKQIVEIQFVSNQAHNIESLKEPNKDLNEMLADKTIYRIMMVSGQQSEGFFNNRAKKNLLNDAFYTLDVKDSYPLIKSRVASCTITY